MRIPVTINQNTIKTYNHENKKRNGKLLHSDDFTQWDNEIPKNLQELCIEAIALNWEENPILDDIPLLIDRCLLLTILSTKLPLTLTVPKIKDDIYWKRCYLERWPQLLPQNVPSGFHINEIVKVNNNSNNTAKLNKNRRTWMECFHEMHTREYLEKLKPENYDAEQIKELADLFGPYIKILNIGELQCSESSPHRIPLNSIITGFHNLTELTICFKQIYVGEKFTWDVLKVPLHDIKLLAKGLEKCKLKIFRLRNSDINDEKALIILKSLLKHEDLQILDLSHCQISNAGAVGLSNFILQNALTDLILTNNQIGVKGVEALCYAISHSSCNLKVIDLKLNPIGEKGGEFLMKPLTIGSRNIKSLFLNGCGLGKSNVSIGEMIEHNTNLECLDLSNNALGEEIGKMILQGLNYNKNLKKLDVRMCKFNPINEFEILQKVYNNRKCLKYSKKRRQPIIVEPQFKFAISEELLNEIENVFQTNVPANVADPE